MTEAGTKQNISSDLGNIYRTKDPFVFTVFGASGSLAKLMIFPALFSLAEQKRFQGDYAIIGYARTEKSQEEFKKEFSKSIKESHKANWGDYQEQILADLLEHVHYVSGQYDVVKDFDAYRRFQEKVCHGKKLQEIFYFSTPPKVFESIIDNLARLKEKSPHTMKIVLEKPFGEDYASAESLYHFASTHFPEGDIYLLDHYLGKKAVRSIFTLRKANRILNLLLRGNEIANIQITAHEDAGVEDRIGYYDRIGVVKDMVQSHLLQILALTIMDIPVHQDSKSVHKEKSDVISSLYFEGEKEHLVLGQYEGYDKASSKIKGSKTPTFCAMKLWLNDKNWYDVPIFVRSGKKLHEKHTYIVIELKKFAFQDKRFPPNRIIIEFFPDERLYIRMVDEDGATESMNEIAQSESISCRGDYCLPSHGLLLLDVLRGEKMHFLSFPEILGAWTLVDAILGFAKQSKTLQEKYSPGSCGPKSQNDMMKGTGFSWYDVHGDSCGSHE